MEQSGAVEQVDRRCVGRQHAKPPAKIKPQSSYGFVLAVLMPEGGVLLCAPQPPPIIFRQIASDIPSVLS